MTTAKRARERTQHDKRIEKEERRAERKKASRPQSDDGEDPDLAGLKSVPHTPLLTEDMLPAAP
jgi:hypothetical protein